MGLGWEVGGKGAGLALWSPFRCFSSLGLGWASGVAGAEAGTLFTPEIPRNKVTWSLPIDFTLAAAPAAFFVFFLLSSRFISLLYVSTL